MQRVKLAFSETGDIVACVASDMEIEAPHTHYLSAGISDELATILIKKFDQPLTQKRFEVVAILAARYLHHYALELSGEPTISIAGRVRIDTTCQTTDELGEFECQFASRSAHVLSCAIMVGDRVRAQLFPDVHEYFIMSTDGTFVDPDDATLPNVQTIPTSNIGPR